MDCCERRVLRRVLVLAGLSRAPASRYVQGLRGASEAEAEARLAETLPIFRFLSDKDVFEESYKRLLAERLLGGMSVDENAEKTMIRLFKVGLR
jgi:hypothetical protein